MSKAEEEPKARRVVLLVGHAVPRCIHFLASFLVSFDSDFIDRLNALAVYLAYLTLHCIDVHASIRMFPVFRF
jgi:hypothetical protein